MKKKLFNIIENCLKNKFTKVYNIGLSDCNIFKIFIVIGFIKMMLS